nr:hypothetical protein CFP56_13212 [Quercus suber]
MPPKKATKAKSEAQPSKEEDSVQPEQVAAEEKEHAPKTEDKSPAEVEEEHESKQPEKEDEEGQEPKEDKSQPSHKRKKSAQPDEPQKAARRSTRGATKSQPSQQQLLAFLLSSAAAPLCCPADETEAQNADSNLRTYSSSALNPFEELLCAIILSRPISHRLGVRSIRTLLNAPYTFTSAVAVRDAGSEKRHQALWDAKTQHKAKTAEQIGELAEVVLEKFTAKDDERGTEMQKLRDDCGHDVPKEREELKSSIKGLGPTGLDIFFRRVQWLWTACYPFVDERTAQALKRVGLSESGEELVQALEKHWTDLPGKDLAGDDEAARKKRAFVVLLERVTGADLEGNVDQVIESAAAAT